METLDNYKEHELHKEFDKNCSTCYSERRAEILEEQKKEEVAMGEMHPCRWCGTPTLNLECDACDKKNDEAYFERHGEDPFADDKQRDLLNDR